MSLHPGRIPAFPSASLSLCTEVLTDARTRIMNPSFIKRLGLRFAVNGDHTTAASVARWTRPAMITSSSSFSSSCLRDRDSSRSAWWWIVTFGDKISTRMSFSLKHPCTCVLRLQPRRRKRVNPFRVFDHHRKRLDVEEVQDFDIDIGQLSGSTVVRV
jgi:hypothetical protein